MAPTSHRGNGGMEHFLTSSLFIGIAEPRAFTRLTSLGRQSKFFSDLLDVPNLLEMLHEDRSPTQRIVFQRRQISSRRLARRLIYMFSPPILSKRRGMNGPHPA